ncbi:HAD family hydrolase [Streptomyces sp. NPDC087300]|uniref:HAD family hydrolase n=1 Tax=Streptomyces sp. NPDC087300 TaxID=3365780 RepID=UPI0038110317
MSSPPPRSPHGAPKSGLRESLIRRSADSHRESPDREVVAGYHNINYVVPLGWWLAALLGTMPFRARVKCRMPRDTVQVVPRIWRSESEVLATVSRHLKKEVPRCYRDFGDWSLHSYRAGQVLSDVRIDEGNEDRMMRAFARFFARTAGVRGDKLPPTPAGWPESGRSQEFFEWLIGFTEDRVHQWNRWRFRDLFEAVGIRSDALRSFRDDRDRPRLTPRPFCLLHTDVHPANVVVDRKRLAVIDWELAMYGDPLHDLATHLVRMDYEKDEQVRMTALWAEEMVNAGHPEMTEGLDTDLPAYLDFEYAQSVFPDIMRAALDLAGLPGEPDHEDFQRAARRVCRALRRAAEPLKLKKVPDEAHAEAALRAWYAGPYGRAQEEAHRAARSARDGGALDEWGAVGDETYEEVYGGAYEVVGADAPAGRAGIGRQAGAGIGELPSVARELDEVRALFADPAGSCVLFDFDGPICRLFPGEASRPAADDFWKLVGEHGLHDVIDPADRHSKDPYDVLRDVARERPGSSGVAALEDFLTDGEVRAAQCAPATRGAHRLIRELWRRGCRIAVVTNNSPRAVASYLHRHGLSEAFGPHIYGRTHHAEQLKPDPDPVLCALRGLGAEPCDAVMIGDTVSDFEAAREAKVRFVGYARDDRKAEPLRTAGAEAVIRALAPLIGLLDVPSGG